MIWYMFQFYIIDQDLMMFILESSDHKMPGFILLKRQFIIIKRYLKINCQCLSIICRSRQNMKMQFDNIVIISMY